MKPLPPGNILQNLYIRKRLKNRGILNFLEIGSGNGYLSHVLLSMGFEGIGCDLNEGACANNKELNQSAILTGKYQVFNEDFTQKLFDRPFDLIISSMVIEHLNTEQLNVFIGKAKENLSQDGLLVLLVPSSMKHWGIEDEIAGHIKRYEFHDFEAFKKMFDLKIEHIAGLTYPISNLLFKLSNLLIKKKESSKLNLTQLERTVYTGNRDVPYKTSFPMAFKIILNEYIMIPFHLLQMAFRKSPDSLVIYCELKKISK